MRDISKVFAAVCVALSFSAGSCNVGDSNESTSDSFNPSSVVIDNSGSSGDDDAAFDGVNPVCDMIMSLDGPDVGFLWKPEGDTTAEGFRNTAVVLLPVEFEVLCNDVFVTTVNGEVEEGVPFGFTNGNRQTWRFSKFGGEYEPRVTCVDTSRLAEVGPQECVWVFPDSSVRQD